MLLILSLILIRAIPAAILRWVILRRSLTIWPATCVTFMILIGLTAIWNALVGNSQPIPAAASALSFTILWRGSTKSRQALRRRSPAHSLGSIVGSRSPVASTPIQPPPIQSIHPVATPFPQLPRIVSSEIEARRANLNSPPDRGFISAVRNFEKGFRQVSPNAVLAIGLVLIAVACLVPPLEATQEQDGRTYFRAWAGFHFIGAPPDQTELAQAFGGSSSSVWLTTLTEPKPFANDPPTQDQEEDWPQCRDEKTEEHD